MDAIDLRLRGLAFVRAFGIVLAAIPVMLLLFLNKDAYCEDSAVVQTYVHSFDNISVYTGVFALNKDLSLQTSVYLKYAVDFVNPDIEGSEGGEDGEGEEGDENELRGDDALRKFSYVAAVSGASGVASTAGGGSSLSDTRNEFLGGITHNFNNIIALDAYLDYSTESDYKSTTPTITLKKDLFEKNTTLTLGYSRNMDTVSGAFMDRSEERNTDNFFFGVTQLISPVAVMQIGYSLNQSGGYMPEGVRLVPVDGVTADTCTAESATCVDESLPDKRNRNAYLVSVSRYFIEGIGGFLNRSAVKLTLRYYDDDWDITSYMGEVEYYKYLTEQAVLRLNYRYYTQTQAFFIKDSYGSEDHYKSSSPQLEEFDTNLAGIKLTYFLKDLGLPPVLLNSIEGKYEYYTESIGVNAHVVMAGLRLAF
ncbi:MAG: DUF3570 domain-containing protein [Deltaproteobacteria bacterium]